MTRLLWTLIALFPLPLVALLLTEPPELFERERVQVAHQIGEEMRKVDIDWDAHFAKSGRVTLEKVLPQAAGNYGTFDWAVERNAASQLVLVPPTISKSRLQYRLADACWVLPADQITLLRRCGS